MAATKLGQTLPEPFIMRLYKRITFTDVNTTFLIGILPERATVIDAGVAKTTVFNSGGAATLDLGTEADDDHFLDGLDVKTAAGRVFDATTMNALTDLYSASERKIYAKVTTASTAPTTGDLVVWLMYTTDAM
jgi:hypothetical protein